MKGDKRVKQCVYFHVFDLHSGILIATDDDSDTKHNMNPTKNFEQTKSKTRKFWNNGNLCSKTQNVSDRAFFPFFWKKSNRSQSLSTTTEHMERESKKCSPSFEFCLILWEMTRVHMHSHLHGRLSICIVKLKRNDLLRHWSIRHAR